MERHVYKFEFKYDRQVNGKKTEFTVPVIVHNECYVDACCKVDEFVKKNFADRVTQESTIQYVGEFVHEVLKPFVEMKEETDVKMFDNMKVKKSKVELVEVIERLKEEVKNERRDRFALVKDGYLLREEVQELKRRVDSLKSSNKIISDDICNKDNQVLHLQRRVREYEAKEKLLNPVDKEDVWFNTESLKKALKDGKQYNFIVGSRGLGKSNFEAELFKQRFKESFLESKQTDVINEMIKKIENTKPHIIDVNRLYCDTDMSITESMYKMIRESQPKDNDVNKLYPNPYSIKEKSSYEKAIDVCKVYQLERDQALKENEVLNQKVTILRRAKNYRDETVNKLVTRIDELEKQMEKEQTVRQSMIKQMQNWKTEMKRKNRIIDALTEVEK